MPQQDVSLLYFLQQISSNFTYHREFAADKDQLDIFIFNFNAAEVR